MGKSESLSWRSYWNKRATHITDQHILPGWASTAGDFDVDVFNWFVKDITTNLNLSPTDRFLEIGCGNGMLLAQLSPFVNQAIGVDLSYGMLSQAVKSEKTYYMSVSEAPYLPFADNTFDKLLLFSVFQYFTSEHYITAVLNEIYRVCTPRGRIFIGNVPSEEEAMFTRRRSFLQWKRFFYPVLLPSLEYASRWSGHKPTTNRHYSRSFFETLPIRPYLSELTIRTEEHIPSHTWNFRYDVLMVLPDEKTL